ncbi:MAG: hypothetical protein KY450_13745, partial [Actinobacteria bacterium]|nr:hypothetical protein [Actinomycetota bacterium]
MGAVRRALQRLEVGLAVATASGVLAVVLGDHADRIGGVEAHADQGARVRGLADLEREAQAAGGVVAPVLGRAAGVVELPALLARVAVLGRHRVT